MIGMFSAFRCKPRWDTENEKSRLFKKLGGVLWTPL